MAALAAVVHAACLVAFSSVPVVLKDLTDPKGSVDPTADQLDHLKEHLDDLVVPTVVGLAASWDGLPVDRYVPIHQVGLAVELAGRGVRRDAPNCLVAVVLVGDCLDVVFVRSAPTGPIGSAVAASGCHVGWRTPTDGVR